MCIGREKARPPPPAHGQHWRPRRHCTAPSMPVSRPTAAGSQSIQCSVGPEFAALARGCSCAKAPSRAPCCRQAKCGAVVRRAASVRVHCASEFRVTTGAHMSPPPVLAQIPSCCIGTTSSSSPSSSSPSVSGARMRTPSEKRKAARSGHFCSRDFFWASAKT
jgi:hypothetical protein